MIVQTNAGVMGPYRSVVILGDRLRCDGIELPFTVLGDYSIVGDDSLATPLVVPKAVPEQVTVVQLKLALLELGDLDAVESALPSLGREAQIKWEDSRRTVRRFDELVIAMRDRLLWTDNRVDELFILASTK